MSVYPVPEGIFLTSPVLDVAGVRHGFFTRKGGVSKGIYAGLNTGLGSDDDRGCVLQNRAIIAGVMGTAANRLVGVYQAHTPDCVVVETPWRPQDNPKADALVTNKTGIAIGVSTADCVPVLFADETARVIGAAHAGWRGAVGGVLEATIAKMEGIGAQRSRIRAAIGPAIRQPNYEVGPDFIAPFLAADADNGHFLIASKREGHALFDLTGYVASRLQKAGLVQIDDLALCTYADEERFFSYRRVTHRREADYGRHLHAIMLV